MHICLLREHVSGSEKVDSVVESAGSVHCARVSELLEQPANGSCCPSLSENSVLNCLALHPFN